jgi:hypothetical protein
MATQVQGVVNLTGSDLQLTNTFAGKVRESDSVTIGSQTYKATGGADNDFIKIPDATPLAKFLEADHIAISNIVVGGNSHTVYIAKDSKQ